MGKRRSITIDTRTFLKAGDARRFFSEMLNRYSLGQMVSNDDAADLAALLKRHDEVEEKIGAGIRCFEVAAAPDGHDGKCFWVVRRDGSKVDFSFQHCLLAKPFDDASA